MYTQCRGCGEVFAVTVDDIITAHAMVRCSSCGSVFNSLHTLSEYKPHADANLILHEHDNPPPLLTHEFKQSIVTEKIVSNTVEGKNSDGLEKEVLYSVQPDFVADQDVIKSNNAAWLWIVLTVALLALLVWQTSLALTSGGLQLSDGKLKDTVCAQINCFTGYQTSNLNKIALVSRSIRQHPGRDNALIITTGIINSDENVQAFPALQVKMSNLDGKIVAMRRFLPKEYIDVATIKAGMLPNTLIPITLELQSPGSNAVTFEIGFSNTFGNN
ncbi:MAG: zinc-ribbon and DUF3426 domain-containing protein [Proteobacteria bacterium]|nr:zinc-ribbon and DUF3426 domain-containing protein [Pseudomonadota bacterium]